MERNLNYYGNLKSAISKSEQEKKELEIQNMALKQGNEQLERINAAFEVALQQSKEERKAAIHELTAAAEESAGRLGAASDVAVKNAEHAVGSINTSLNSTKAKIE